MIPRFVHFVVVLLMPLAAAAQEVTVRSGDHETFTRLVFNLPSRIGWTLENSAAAAVLRFERRGLTFDTATVFERVGRDRIADLVVDLKAQSVSLRFACDCRAEAFWFRDAMLVVDVSEASEAATDNRTDAGADIAGLGEIPNIPPLPQRGASAATELVRDAIGTGAPAVAVPAAPEAMPMDIQRGVEIAESRDRLLRQISRATSQGLLDPKSSLTARRPREAAAPEPEPRQGSEAEPAPPKPRPTSNMHINVQTSIDRDFLATLAGEEPGLLTGGCLDARLLDVASWGSDAPFWEQVGPLRAQMTSEFDRTEDRPVRDLAKVYIHFGFGLEAQQVIDLLPEDEESTQIFRALARIMDGGTAEGSILADQLDCGAPAAMWSALSYAALPKDARLDKDAMLRAFSALPRHLRMHLGPILSARLLEAGHTKESASILRVLDRVEETKTPAADMVAADLEMSKGEPEAAEALLETVVEANGVLSPKALARKIDSQIARGRAVSFDHAELAAAYAFEHAGTDLGRVMARSHVLALAGAGAFDEAFSEMGRIDTETGVRDEDIRAELTTRLASHGASFEVLRHVLSGATARPADLPQETALSLAEQLLDAGFHQQSRAMLAQTFHGQNARQARLIRARAALELEQPRQAEVELLGLDGQDVNVLRARARSMVGEHRQAYELFKSAGMEDEASREAWLADDWTGDGRDGATGETTQTQEGDGTAVLAQNKALLDAAGTTREDLRALLSEAPAPVLEN